MSVIRSQSYKFRRKLCARLYRFIDRHHHYYRRHHHYPHYHHIIEVNVRCNSRHAISTDLVIPFFFAETCAFLREFVISLHLRIMFFSTGQKFNIAVWGNRLLQSVCMFNKNVYLLIIPFHLKLLQRTLYIYSINIYKFPIFDA